MKLKFKSVILVAVNKKVSPLTEVIALFLNLRLTMSPVKENEASASEVIWLSEKLI